MSDMSKFVIRSYSQLRLVRPNGDPPIPCFSSWYSYLSDDLCLSVITLFPVPSEVLGVHHAQASCCFHGAGGKHPELERHDLGLNWSNNLRKEGN